jgi:hypothetical protein
MISRAGSGFRSQPEIRSSRKDRDIPKCLPTLARFGRHPDSDESAVKEVRHADEVFIRPKLALIFRSIKHANEGLTLRLRRSGLRPEKHYPADCGSPRTAERHCGGGLLHREPSQRLHDRNHIQNRRRRYSDDLNRLFLRTDPAISIGHLKGGKDC